jgi:hypothetical protein
MIHKDSSDHLRTESKKMHSAFASDISRANQLKVSLIGQCGRLETVAGLAAGHVSSRNLTQLRVNQRHQEVERVFISLAPGGNQPAYVL